MDHIHSAAELYLYVSATATGLQLLAALPDPERMERMSPELYGQLVAFLGRFYEQILLDLGTGLTEPLALRARARRPRRRGRYTGVDHLQHRGRFLRYIAGRIGAGRLSLVLNQMPRNLVAERAALEERFRRYQVPRRVTIPYDQRLRTMLDSGTYTCDRLDRPTRLAVKRLGLAVCEQPI